MKKNYIFQRLTLTLVLLIYGYQVANVVKYFMEKMVSTKHAVKIFLDEVVYDRSLNIFWTIEDDYDLYNSDQSSTYYPDGRNFSIYYADDGVSAYGFYSKDTVMIGGMLVKNQSIAQATQFPGNVYDVNIDKLFKTNESISLHQNSRFLFLHF